MRGVHLLAAVLAMLLPVGAFAGHTYESTYGGSGDDVARAVLETQNGKYLLVGYSKSSGNETWDGYLVEVAPHGEQIWQKFVDLGGDEFFNDELQLSNSDYLLAGKIKAQGSDNTDALLVRTDSSGNVLWHKTYGGSENDAASAIAACPDGNFIFVGSTKSYGHGNYDVWVVKVNPSGDTLWTRTFGGTTEEEAQDVAVDASGNIYISARTFNPYAPDFYMLDLAPNASTHWIVSFGTGGWEEGFGVSLLGERAVFAGYLHVGGGRSHDMCAVCMKADGDTAWTGHYGTYKDEYAYAVTTTPNNNLVMVGEQRLYSGAQKDAVVVKITASGQQLWFKEFAHDKDEIFRDVMVTSDGYYVLVGFTNSFGHGGRDMYLVKTTPDGEVTSVASRSTSATPRAYSLLVNYPNPFNPSTHVRFELPRAQEVELVVKDVRGHTVKVLQRGKLAAGVHDVVWQGQDERGQTVSSGVYFCILRSGNRVLATHKMMLLK